MKQVRLRGLYDERRAVELADAMIPIIRGECDTIDMTAVEHIERVALTGFLPLIKKLQPGIAGPKIAVIGMNEEIERTLNSTGLIRYFHEERRTKGEISS